ncbi:hypothetical protein DIPPA_30641, partial [Diplonema papillatum]
MLSIGSVELFSLAPLCFRERVAGEDNDEGESSVAGSNSPGRISACDHRRHSNSSSHTHTKYVVDGTEKKTGLFLQQLEATVAVCRLQEFSDTRVFDVANQVVRCAVDAAVLTDGALLALCGEDLILAWNTAKTCRMHTTAAIHFASDLQRRCRLAVVRVGIASGPLQHGNVGTLTKRFSTVMGRTVAVASLAASLTTLFQTFCLVADYTTSSSLLAKGNITAFLRLVDIWCETAIDRKVMVYQFLTSRLRDTDSIWGESDDSENRKHDQAFREAMAGDATQLAQLRAASEADATLK